MVTGGSAMPLHKFRLYLIPNPYNLEPGFSIAISFAIYLTWVMVY
ncbi:hypothetical protein [Phormidesmis priestleyi]|nr:hypothetical protein [Phormidesmis priestleyi]